MTSRLLQISVTLAMPLLLVLPASAEQKPLPGNLTSSTHLRDREEVIEVFAKLSGHTESQESSSLGRGSVAAAVVECSPAQQREPAFPGEVTETVLTGCDFIPLADRGGSVVDLGVVAREAVLRLPIPSPVAQVGPPPEVNEWNMVAVGYPLWLWVDGPDTHTAVITQQGITLMLVARRMTTRFDHGDGTFQYCGLTPLWYPALIPGTPSPGCGHVYQRPALVGETLPVTATTLWEVTWTGLGQSGVLDHEVTGPPTDLPVGELHALRLR